MYTTFWRPVAAVFLLAFLAGCATSGRGLDEPSKQHLRSTDVILHIPQDSLLAQVKSSSSGATTGMLLGGVFGAVIGGMLDSKVDDVSRIRADMAIEPIRSSLDGYAFERKLKAAVDRSLASSAWLNARPAKIYKGEGTIPEFDILFDRSDADAILVAKVYYVVSADLAEIQIGINTELFPNNPELAAAEGIERHPEPDYAPSGAIRNQYFPVAANLLHKNELRYAFEVSEDREESREASAYRRIWAKVPAATLLGQMDLGMSKLAGMLVADTDSLGALTVKGPTTKVDFWPNKVVASTPQPTGTLYRGKKGGWAFRSNWKPGVTAVAAAPGSAPGAAAD